jgi:hypothetical protein
MKNKETLEEAADKYVEDFELSFYDTVEEIPVKEIAKKDFIQGAKWQQEKMYSEEEVLKLLITFSDDRTFLKKDVAIKWFEQFKKK